MNIQEVLRSNEKDNSTFNLVKMYCSKIDNYQANMHYGTTLMFFLIWLQKIHTRKSMITQWYKKKWVGVWNQSLKQFKIYNCSLLENFIDTFQSLSQILLYHLPFTQWCATMTTSALWDKEPREHECMLDTNPTLP